MKEDLLLDHSDILLGEKRHSLECGDIRLFPRVLIICRDGGFHRSKLHTINIFLLDSLSDRIVTIYILFSQES